VVIKRIQKSDSGFPQSLQLFLGKDAPASAATLGNLQLLGYPKLAIFCSGSCPGGIISATEQVMHKIIAAGVTVIGGFHSTVEKHCLQILLSGDHPIILSPARSLDKLRIRTEYKKPLENGRLLFLSFFRSHRHRSDTEMALKRNRYVAALAQRVLMVHASPCGKTEELCRELMIWLKPVYTVDNKANQNLFGLGARAFDTNEDLVSGFSGNMRNEDSHELEAHPHPKSKRRGKGVTKP
jgi:predicted Rossmann fold nucleotide-binding protein DprA/Smf involved in DNA uptake